MPRPLGIFHIAYLAALGVAGWALLVALSVWPPPVFTPLAPDWEWVVLALLVGTSRLLGFKVFRRQRIALDSAFYVAIRFVWGTLPAAWLVAVTLTIDGLINMAAGRGPIPRREESLGHALAYAVNHGGLPSLVLIATSFAFGGDRPLAEMADLTLVYSVLLFALVFPALHYAIAGADSLFGGTSSGPLFKNFYLRVVGAELTLAPLSLAMTLVYKHQGIELFLLLGATGLLFGGIFRKLMVVSGRLRQRVDELSAINRIGRTISDSYDQKSLYKNLSVASIQLVGHSSLFMIGTVDERGESVNYEIYDDQGDCIQQINAERSKGLSGYVMRNKAGLCLGDLQKDYLKYASDERYNDPNYHSWLGVPLVVYGEVVGVMSVQSQDRHAYTLAHLRVLATIADQAAVAIENSRLYQLATVDGLTGLFVRRYFDQRLTEEWHRTARYGNPFCLGMFDLDHFKRLNDTHGHQVGDQVLREAARAVRANMRSFDVAARYGGEEFAFILPRTSLAEAVRVAERIRIDVQEIAIEAPDSEVKVTTSIGLAQFPGDGIQGVTDLLAQADAALYRAKSAGRNRVEIVGTLEQTEDPGLQAGGTL